LTPLLHEICLNLPCFLLMYKWTKSSLGTVRKLVGTLTTENHPGKQRGLSM